MYLKVFAFYDVRLCGVDLKICDCGRQKSVVIYLSDILLIVTTLYVIYVYKISLMKYWTVHCFSLRELYFALLTYKVNFLLFIEEK